MPCYEITVTHAAASYGQPVFVGEDGVPHSAAEIGLDVIPEGMRQVIIPDDLVMDDRVYSDTRYVGRNVVASRNAVSRGNWSWPRTDRAYAEVVLWLHRQAPELRYVSIEPTYVMVHQELPKREPANESHADPSDPDDILAYLRD